MEPAGAGGALARRHRNRRRHGADHAGDRQVQAARLPVDGAAQTSPSITTNDPQRIGAVISDAGDQVMHEYLLADPDSSTIVELAMWSSLPPQVDWPAVADAQVLDAMAAPLCSAYIGSCR